MRYNEFNVRPVTSKPYPEIEPGNAVIDCGHEHVYNELLTDIKNHDNTYNKDIMQEEFVYLPDFPSKVISYEEMVKYGKDKYYWDALNQRLYKFDVLESTKPFVVQQQTLVGTEGNPTQTVDVLREFSKVDGTFFEQKLDTPVSTYITISGHPSQYAPRPYVEGTYYYDKVHDKYYIFKSYYTQHKNNYYYNKLVEDSIVLHYNNDKSAWETINSAKVLEGSPNDLIEVTSENIDDINKEIYYCDRLTDTLYLFDYGQYFVKINYTNTIYERPFEFYRRLQDVLLDVNKDTRINTKDIFYFTGETRKIVNPSEERIYYNTKQQKYYMYNKEEASFTEIPQGNLFINQTFFPKTHSKI